MRGPTDVSNPLIRLAETCDQKNELWGAVVSCKAAPAFFQLQLQLVHLQHSLGCMLMRFNTAVSICQLVILTYKYSHRIIVQRSSQPT